MVLHRKGHDETGQESPAPWRTAQDCTHVCMRVCTYACALFSGGFRGPRLLRSASRYLVHALIAFSSSRYEKSTVAEVRKYVCTHCNDLYHCMISFEITLPGVIFVVLLPNLSNMTCARVVDATCSHGMSAHGSVSLHAACVLASLAAVMLFCRSQLALLDRRS